MFELNPSEEPRLSITAFEPAPITSDAEFAAKLRAATPNVVLTDALVGINLMFFVAMLFNGAYILQPKASVLLQLGANFGPRTISQGEWWRLPISMFMHIGIVHLAFNMFVLLRIGPFMERLLGDVGFLTVYMISGLAGGIASLAWNPYTVSAGASGAIFGLFGALLGLLLTAGRNAIPGDVLAPLRTGALIFIGYNAVFGVLAQGVALMAHAGGLLAGFLCGLLLGTPLTFEQAAQLRLRASLVAVAAAALLLGAAAILPRPVDLAAELKQLSATETRTLTAYRSLMLRVAPDRLRDEQVANALETEILPDWVHEHNALSRLTGLPEAQQKLISTAAQYMDLRQQGWSMLALALRQHNLNVARQATAKQLQADELHKKSALARQ